jgi:hypothetical protein
MRALVPVLLAVVLVPPAISAQQPAPAPAAPNNPPY